MRLRLYPNPGALVIMAVLLIFAGCKTVTGPPPPLAPGYSTADDQKMGTTLAGVNGFYHSIQCETQGLGWDLPSKSCVPSPRVTAPMILGVNEKQAFNAMATSLNVANAVYVSYHNGQATQAEAQTAIDRVQAQQSALQTQIQAVK